MSDRRFADLLEAFAADPELAPIVADFAAGRRQPSKKFGANGLKVNGRIFAMLVRGNLVVKLPRQRAEALVAAGQGEPFDPGHGRKMKEWVTILSPTLLWADLAREGHAFVAGAKRPGSRASDTGAGSKLRVAKPAPAAGQRPPGGKK